MTKRTKRRTNFIYAAILSSGVTSISMAADDGPHDKAIKGRQALMQTYSFNLGILSDMVKGETPYDAEVAAASAENLLAAANMKQSAMWPPGSDSETAGNAKNRALATIWETYPDIAGKADELVTAAAALAPIAGSGLDALEGATGDAGAACKGCHDDFRADSD